MSNRLYYATEIPCPFEATWAAMDFPAPGWTLKGGGPREIGTTRSMEVPEMGLIVDELLAYDRTDNHASFRYGLINEDNFIEAKGWEGTVTLYRNVKDPSRCFYVYTSRWDSVNEEKLQGLAAMMDGMVQQMIEGIRAASA